MPKTYNALTKKIGLAIVSILSLVACEKDLNDIAVGIVDKNDFSTGDTAVNIIAYNINIDSNRVDGNNEQKQPLTLLGVTQNDNFGHMRSAIASQMYLPITGVNFGENTVIDLVVLDIPYYATKDAEDQEAVDPDTGEPILDDDDNPVMVPSFQIDSIYGNTNQAFNITVNELGTFLNALNPENPTENQKYYSDKVFQLKDEIYSGSFLPNRNDTVLYVERRYLDNDPNTVDDIDTVKATNAQPTMKFFLDQNFFKTRFVDHQNSSDFASNDNFIHYFRGVYIDAQGQDGSLINPLFSQANITIYYTDDQIRDEDDDEDLNGNGTNGEEGVTVRTKQIMIFPLSGVRAGNYQRNYDGALIQNYLINPNKDDGEDKLFAQGAAGSEVIIELFNDGNLDYFRDQNWLINEANLTLYIDGDQKEVPERLFLYNKDYNSLLYTYMFEGLEIYGGELEYDSDGNPESYKFRITKFVSDILNPSDPKAPNKLALRNYLSTDLPANISFDTITEDYNFIPKGVILKGNLPENEDKKLKLEIFYSKLNETNN